MSGNAELQALVYFALTFFTVTTVGSLLVLGWAWRHRQFSDGERAPSLALHSPPLEDVHPGLEHRVTHPSSPNLRPSPGDCSQSRRAAEETTQRTVSETVSVTRDGPFDARGLHPPAPGDGPAAGAR